jgi:hypothetical protein
VPKFGNFLKKCLVTLAQSAAAGKAPMSRDEVLDRLDDVSKKTYRDYDYLGYVLTIT